MLLGPKIRCALGGIFHQRHWEGKNGTFLIMPSTALKRGLTVFARGQNSSLRAIWRCAISFISYVTSYLVNHRSCATYAQSTIIQHTKAPTLLGRPKKLLHMRAIWPPMQRCNGYMNTRSNRWMGRCVDPLTDFLKREGQIINQMTAIGR